MLNTKEGVHQHYIRAARDLMCTVIPMLAKHYAKNRHRKQQNRYGTLFFRVQELNDFLGEHRSASAWGEDTEEHVLRSFQDLLAVLVIDKVLPHNTAQRLLNEASLWQHHPLEVSVRRNQYGYAEDGVSPLVPSLLEHIDIQAWSQHGSWRELSTVIRAIDVLNTSWNDCTVTSEDYRTRKVHERLNELLTTSMLSATEVLSFLPWSFGPRGATEDLLHSEHVLTWNTVPEVVFIVKTLSAASMRGVFGTVDVPELVEMFRGNPSLPPALAVNAVINVGADRELSRYVESDYYMKTRIVLTVENYHKFSKFHWKQALS